MAITANCFSQKVSVDDKSVRIQYRQMANTPIAESDRTFTVIPKFEKKTESIKRMEDLRIEGLTYVNTDTAGIVINVNYSGITDNGTEVETITSKVKQKDGTEKTVDTYRARLRYTYYLDYIVYDREGKEINQNVLHRSISVGPANDDDSFVSEACKTPEEAKKYIRTNKAKFFKDKEDDIITDLLNTMCYSLEEAFGYPTDTQKALVQYLDSKKHPEYEEHQKLCNDIINGLSMLTANGGVDEAIVALTPSEEYLKQIPDRYTDTKDKNHLIMRFISYYDLALIYAHTDRWDLAKDMIAKAIDNGYEVKDCKKLNEWIEKQHGKLKNNNMTSLHFRIPEGESIDEEHPAQWIAEIKAEEEEAARKAAAAAEAARKAATAAVAAAKQAELNADENLGEIEVVAISPTRLKVTVTVTNEQVKEKINTVKLIVKNNFLDITNPNYLHDAAVSNKSYTKCNIGSFSQSSDGSKLTTVISGLEIDALYSVMAYTNWNGIVKYTSDACVPTLKLNEEEEWVDLGLSVKWASRNMGAKSATKLGNLYTWYVTDPCVDKVPVPHSFVYDELPQSIAGDPQHDAATAAFGDGAQTPSLVQWKELFSRCEVSKIKYKRVGGYYFESLTTHNAIFIPFTDFYSDSKPRGDNNCGLYWTSEKTTDAPQKEGEIMDYIRYYMFGQVMKHEGNIKYFGKLNLRAVKK